MKRKSERARERERERGGGGGVNNVPNRSVESACKKPLFYVSIKLIEQTP